MDLRWLIILPDTEAQHRHTQEDCFFFVTTDRKAWFLQSIKGILGSDKKEEEKENNKPNNKTFLNKKEKFTSITRDLAI